MNKARFTLIVATLSLGVLGLGQAGDSYGGYRYSAKGGGKVPYSAPQHKCCDSSGCCDNTGYLFGYGGVSFLEDFSGLRSSGSGSGSSFEFDGDTGYLIGAGAGVRSRAFGGSRFEVEGLLRENDVNVGSGGNSQIQTTAVLINFLKEFPIGHLIGHIGGGIGWATSDLSVTTSNGRLFSDNHSNLAYQFLAGVDLPVNDCLSLFLQYKFLRVGDADYAIGGQRVWAERNFSHNVVAGLRIGF